MSVIWPFLRGAGRIGGALTAAFLLAAGVIWAAHGSPSAALAALWDGAFGGRYAWGSTLAKATPLLLTGLGVAVAFRARLWNVGGEGQFLVGALAAAVAGHWAAPAWVVVPCLLCAGTAAGALWGGLAGWMRVKRGVPEVISTIMLNFVASDALAYLVGFGGPLQERSHARPSSEALPGGVMLASDLPRSPLHAGFALALLATGTVAVLLNRTRWGFAVRLAGANPAAARASGWDVGRTQARVLLVSGALCGLAGAVELAGQLGSLPGNYAPGYGFAAVAVALLARLNPFGVLLSALFFGALGAGAGAMERSAGVSSVLVDVVQGAVLLVLVGAQWVRWER